MGYSRQQFVEKALQEVGLASYVYDLSPDELDSACQRLDSMMAAWNGKGIRLGYPLPGIPELTSLTEETGVPDSANEAIITNLAVRIAPSYGKAVSMDTKTIAKESFNVLLSRAARPKEVSLAGMPVGAGNKRIEGDYFSADPKEPLTAGPDSTLDFI